MHQWHIRALGWEAKIVLPVLLLAVALGLVSGIGQVGFAVTPQALAPQWNRVNPATGLKRLLSMRGTVESVQGPAQDGAGRRRLLRHPARRRRIGRPAADHATSR